MGQKGEWSDRCECGKATFSSERRARSHARWAHSERMRVYRCSFGNVHLTRQHNSRGGLVRRGWVGRAAKDKRRSQRRSVKQALSDRHDALPPRAKAKLRRKRRVDPEAPEVPFVPPKGRGHEPQSPLRGV